MSPARHGFGMAGLWKIVAAACQNGQANSAPLRCYRPAVFMPLVPIRSVNT
jgi:hypothetical protein